MLKSLFRKLQGKPLEFKELARSEPVPVSSTLLGGILDSQIIRIEHHKGECQTATGKEIAVDGSFDLPSFATQATVFLSGWSLEYRNPDFWGHSDHHIWAAGTYISNSRIEDGKLRWEARGYLADGGQDDRYEWCYHYTVIAWDGNKLNCVASHRDIENLSPSFGTTPLVSLPSYFHSNRLRSKKTCIPLPRGFVFHFGEDHHLLHIAYNLTHSENFVEHGKKYGVLPPPPLDDSTSKVNEGFVSWDTHGIFRDNNYLRKFKFYTWNSVLGGDEIGVVQPPFTTIPTIVRNNIASGLQGETTQEFTIENIPYDFAVPMLTGWELRYEFGDDEELTKMGVWLDDIQYGKLSVPTVDTGGTLRYKITSALYDRNKKPGYDFNHKVTILGFNPGRPNIPNAPVDL